MSYSKTTNFTAKDSLPTGNAAKLIKGVDFDTEFDAIQAASVASDAAIAAHLADTVDAHDASAISSVPAGNLAATTVQAAIDELDSEKAKVAGDFSQTFAVATASGDTHAVPKLQMTTADAATLSSAQSYADSLVVGLWDDRGAYDASVNTFPAGGGSGTAGAIKKGDIWTISIAGVLGGVAVGAGDAVRALVDAPGQTASNWALQETNFGYTPENLGNKVTSISGASTNDQYPSAKLLYDQLALKQAADADLTTWAGVTPGAGVTTFLATPTLANFNAALSDADVATGGGTATGTNTGDQTATTVSNTPAGNIAATNVQAAINELDTEKMAIATYDTDGDGLVDRAETLVLLCRNTTGVTISKMAAVYITGASGQNPTIALAKADSEATSSKTIGIVTADIANNATGYVAMRGTLHDYNTSSFADGTTLWLSAATAGALTTTRPTAPNHAVLIGFTAYSHANNGKIALYITNGLELDELHDVLITTVANNELLQYDSATATWKNRSTLAGLTFTAPILGTPASGDLRNCSLAVAPAIGGTTPNTGAFTTLSATGNATIGNQVAATNVFLSLNGVVSKAAGIAFKQSGVDKWLFGNGAASENNKFEIYNTATGIVVLSIDNATNASTLTSIQNTPIGSTTPAAGAFTTLSATGTIIAVEAALTKAAGGEVCSFSSTGGTPYGRIADGTYTLTYGIDSTNPSSVSAFLNGTNGLRILSNGSLIGAFSSTGLAVTGAISASGNAALASGTGTTSAVTIGSPAQAIDGGSKLVFQNSNATKNWQISSNLLNSGALDITPSTTNGGTTFTTPVATVSSTGLAVTGSITSTVAAAGAFTTLSASGLITQTLASGQLFNNASIGTSNGYFHIGGTNSDVYLGVESSSPMIISGSMAYDTVLTGKAGISFSANNGTNLHARISSTGLSVTGQVSPSAHNTYDLGTTGVRWKDLWLQSGAFNGSDARLKTAIAPLTANEINAAKQLSKEIGTYQWLESVQKKGDAARHHVGFTVQRAIEILQANGCDPFAYGFIGYDKWDDVFIEHAEILPVEAVVAKEAVLDVDGTIIEPAIAAVEAVEGKAAWTEHKTVAGDAYSFRYDQLNMFVAAGLEARLSALEAK